MRKLLVVAVLTAALTGCTAEDGKDFAGNTISGGSDTTTETTEPKAPAPAPKREFDMGYEATVNDDSGDTLKVKLANARVLQPDPDAFDSPATQGQYVAVDVTFTALAAAQDVNPFDFVALAPGGARVEPTIPCCGVTNDLNSATLNTGETLSGTVVFDVPPGVTGIAYAPLSQVLGTWKVAL